MKNKWGKVIYVGKAKSLKSRVSSYFDRTSDLTLAKRQMVGKIADIETILCETEVEALVLETNLIKHLTPKYNILMKDDKNLAYLKITNSPVPELVKTRIKMRDGWEYYGPYVAWVEQSVRALRRIFRIRNCRIKFETRKNTLFVSSWGTKDLSWKWIDALYGRNDKNNIQITDKAGKTIPCMDYYIWLCPAPCLLENGKIEEHARHIDLAREFLSGRSSIAIETLDMQMREQAKTLDFEGAQETRDTLEVLRWLHERQKVRDIIEWDVDIFLMYEKYDKVYIALTQIRSSQIIGVSRHEVVLHADDRENIVTSFLMRQYVDQEDVPDLLMLTETIDDEAFIAFLSSQRVAIEYPQIGPKKDLLDFTRNQLREYAYKREMATLENKTLTREHMANVLKRLWYPVPKKWEITFECYDISHTHGQFTYASQVLISNGKPDPSRYKKYKIKTLEAWEIDDYASHREVMMRRIIEWLEFGNLPHLIIIDGGKWQLSSAISGIKEWIWKYENQDPQNPDERKISKSEKMMQEGSIQPSNIPTLQHSNIPICSIAKRAEEIFLPEEKVSILFEKGSPELMVLQKARDEAHRFSITANRSARMKSMKKNILEELPWIGPVTRKKLLKLAGSVDGIKTLSEEVMLSVCTKAQLETLRDHGIVDIINRNSE